MSRALPRAHELGLIGCHVCGLVCRDTGLPEGVCPRCESALHRRVPGSRARTWALLIAAFIFYIPANFLPIMRTASLGDADDNTILSGVVELWVKGSPDLAVIVFTASIVVPMLKFLVMATLLLTVHCGTNWARTQRAKLYRLVELIGYWSMLDVFVVSLLTALVQFGFFSEVEPLPGVVYFGLTVVLTMLAAMSFDQRLIWDCKDEDD
ncbi:MAG TPA: paraquat-inducible protein A [Dyella sp.]|uniref:paraquat-inducible protein A n=1 Tax=Dyella sp. TaxID=1869338 RepID=UPI002CF4E1D4|nr:paraquat-inducible protein A [Dyella sp.]HTV85715.1 paraquat-inducible protein A [Dyella sp.]